MCGHKVPYKTAETNEAYVIYGSLNLHPEIRNGTTISVLSGTWEILIGIIKWHIRKRDYTEDQILCRTFGGNKEKYDLAWANVNTPFSNNKDKSFRTAKSLCRFDQM